MLIYSLFTHYIILIHTLYALSLTSSPPPHTNPSDSHCEDVHAHQALLWRLDRVCDGGGAGLLLQRPGRLLSVGASTRGGLCAPTTKAAAGQER